MPHALIIDDDRHSLEALELLVAHEGFSTATANTLAGGRRLLDKQRPDLVLTDLVLPDGDGTELLRELEDAPDIEVIMVTGNATVETAVEALRRGAYDYLTKPINVARLKTQLAGFTRTRALKREVSSLRGELRKLGRFGSMIGTSPAMQKIYDLIERVAPTQASVLVIGESGTGKELVASTLHELSRRRDRSYLPINCGAIAANLIESELFGHERGSFTGAERLHKGYFERADGGTLFLDEITEMPIELQVKLLRVLETQQVLRVGGTQPIDIDVRVIAATNRDPAKAVEAGKLREDLYYRLQVFPIELPPLRQREGDVAKLAEYFLTRLNEESEAQKKLSDGALEQLARYPWPGNVRELKNVVERAFILADETIDAAILPIEIDGDADASVMSLGPYLQVRVGSSIAVVEKRLILATLDQLDGDKRQAADVLGISLKTLYNRLNAYAEETAIAAGDS